MALGLRRIVNSRRVAGESEPMINAITHWQQMNFG
jgi:hypothetical protein